MVETRGSALAKGEDDALASQRSGQR